MPRALEVAPDHGERRLRGILKPARLMDGELRLASRMSGDGDINAEAPECRPIIRRSWPGGVSGIRPSMP